MLLHQALLGSWRTVIPQMYKHFSIVSGTEGVDLKRFKNWTANAALIIAGSLHTPDTKQHEDCVNKFKGDSLEILAEIFFKLSGAIDPTYVQLRGYTPCNSSEDFGVDGTGFNANNDEVAVQIKYRANPKSVISYADIARTFADGTVKYKLDLTKPHTILLFTTSNEISLPCKKFFSDTKILDVLNFDKIDYFIKNNKGFWIEAWKEVQESLSGNTPIQEKKPEGLKYKATFAGIIYSANTLKELLVAVVTDVGPEKIYAEYKCKAVLLKSVLQQGDRPERYSKITKDSHIFYLYTHLSEKDCWKRIQDIAECLNLEWSKS